MDETDKTNIVALAVALGFTVSDRNELKCTHEQLCIFAATVAAATVEQMENTQ